MVIGIDIDGILAEFNVGYAAILTRLTGIQFPEGGKTTSTWPDTWYWDQAAGVTKEQEAAAWAEIKGSTDFWRKLPIHKDAEEFLMWLRSFTLNKDLDCYFITNRMGVGVQEQTTRWLEIYGFQRPAVVIASDKAGICNAIGVTHYIDDKNENCQAVAEKCPGTRPFMLVRPWNKYVGVERLDSLKEFRGILEKGRRNG